MAIAINRRGFFLMDDWRVVAGIFATVAVAALGSFWSWMSGKQKGRVDSQRTIQDGFSTLVSELQEERKQLMNVIAAQAMRITDLEGEVRNLSQLILSMERLMMKNGLSIPPVLPNRENVIE